MKRIFSALTVVLLWAASALAFPPWIPSVSTPLTDSTSTTSSTTGASATAVKSAYDLANAALPKSGGTMAGPLSLGTSYLSTTKTVGATGTTANKLCTIEAATGKVNTAPVSAVGVLGIAVTTRAGGSDLTTEVTTRGIGSVVMDTGSTSVVGNLAVVGTTVAGTAKDSGFTDSTSISNNVQILGKFLSVASPTNAASIQFYGPGHYGTKLDDPGNIGDRIPGSVTASIPGTSLTAGSVYYMSGAGLALAKADSASTMPGICVAVSTTQCVHAGPITTGSWTQGDIIYVSAGTAGLLTATAPSTAGQFVQRVGIALTTTTVLIMPSLDVGGL